MFRRHGSDGGGGDGAGVKLDVARCSHYSSTDNIYDESNIQTPLTGNRISKRKEKATDNVDCGARTSKFFLFPLVSLVIASLVYSYRLQNQLSFMSSEISSLHRNVSSLQSDIHSQSAILFNLEATVTNQSSVIARFENSVSNSDVLDKLKALKKEWNESQTRVEAEMDDTKTEIRQVLDSTKKSIDETVTAAQNEIHAQVALVQSNLSTYIRTTQDQFSTENSFMVYQLAGTFTLLGCLISMWHMTSHLRRFQQPFVQRKILAILWMCPIYSVTSWLSLVIPKIEGYLAIIKDLYEAYVIYQFLSFLIAVLGKGDREAVVDLLAQHADHLSPPVRCFGWCRKEFNYIRGEEAATNGNKQLADDVLLQCQVFAMQFVFLRPLLTAILFALKKMDYHGPMFGPGSPFDHDVDLGGDEDSSGQGVVDYRSPQFYLVILENLSVFMAFSGLLKFYHAVQEDLSWCRPFPKFLCIKGVVFMTFWQGVVISLLADTTDLLGSDDGNDEQEEIMAKQTQNFLICLEMLGFSIAHFYCFPVEEWEEGYRPLEDKGNFGDNMALGDFLHDLKLILRHNKNKKRVKDKLTSGDSISTVLEEDEELGDSESTDNGLVTLLEDVEGLLESRERSARASSQRQNHNVPASRSDHSLISSRTDLFKTLEEVDAPRELRDATALLLQSSLLDEATAKLLTHDILDLSNTPKPSENDNDVQPDDSVSDSQREDILGSSGHGGYCDQEYSIFDDTVTTLNSEEVTASETSALRVSHSDSEEVLRPSIFTMHSSHSLE